MARPRQTSNRAVGIAMVYLPIFSGIGGHRAVPPNSGQNPTEGGSHPSPVLGNSKKTRKVEGSIRKLPKHFSALFRRNQRGLLEPLLLSFPDCKGQSQL